MTRRKTAAPERPVRYIPPRVLAIPVDPARVEQVAKRHLLAGEDRRVGGTRW